MKTNRDALIVIHKTIVPKTSKFSGARAHVSKFCARAHKKEIERTHACNEVNFYRIRYSEY